MGGDGVADEREEVELRCNGMECNGLEWNGMGWNGMEWNGMEWNGMEWPLMASAAVVLIINQAYWKHVMDPVPPTSEAWPVDHEPPRDVEHKKLEKRMAHVRI